MLPEEKRGSIRLEEFPWNDMIRLDVKCHSSPGWRTTGFRVIKNN